MVFAASALVFAGPPAVSMAEQLADQQSDSRAPASAIIDEATAAAITAEGELTATVRTFHGDSPSAVYRYYWWRDGCYVRYQPGRYELVTADYCHR